MFTAQLSDSAGSFSEPDTIGTLTGTSSGTINVTIPLNTKTSTKYKIRVISSYPRVISTDIGLDITIYQRATPAILGRERNVCEFSLEKYSTNIVSGNTVQWYVTGGNMVGSSTSDIVTVDWGSSGNGKIKVVHTVQTSYCKDSLEKNIYINPLPHVEIKGDGTLCQGKEAMYESVNVEEMFHTWSVEMA